MNKTEAAAMFGGKYSQLAAALGITPGAISQWPEELTREQTDRVIGAAVRLGLLKTLGRQGNFAA